MRLLPVGCLALGLALPAAAVAQDAPQLFAPAPHSPPVSTSDARTTPVVRAALPEMPVPTARPAPEIRSTLSEPPAPIPPVRAAFTEAPPLPIARPAPEIRSTVSEPMAQTPQPMARPDYEARKISFADGVSASFDIPYADLPGFRPLTLDIYTPRPQSVPLPMVVYVHGGSWKGGDSRHALTATDFPRALAALAAQGYVVASINYRLSQEARFPAALQDVKSAIRWLRTHASAYNGDMTRVAVWGASAGGQLAAMAGTTCGVMRFEPDGDISPDAPSDCAEAVIDWFGPTDLQSPAPYNSKPGTGGFAAGSSSEVGGYLGCEPAACAPGLVRLASPLTFISANTPPFLIQQGAADTEVPPKQSQQLYEALKAQGVPAEIVLYPDVGHGFVRGNAPDSATVAKAMARLTAFLAATFPNKPRPQIKTTVAN
jgi:acetyl esterase/lipase